MLSDAEAKQGDHPAPVAWLQGSCSYLFFASLGRGCFMSRGAPQELVLAGNRNGVMDPI